MVSFFFKRKKNTPFKNQTSTFIVSHIVSKIEKLKKNIIVKRIHLLLYSEIILTSFLTFLISSFPRHPVNKQILLQQEFV